MFSFCSAGRGSGSSRDPDGSDTRDTDAGRSRPNLPYERAVWQTRPVKSSQSLGIGALGDEGPARPRQGSTIVRIHSRVPFGANARIEIDASLFGSGSIATA